MITVPCEVLLTLAALPDKQPCKVILNFDGQGGVTIETFERQKIRKPFAAVLLSDLLKTNTVVVSLLTKAAEVPIL